MRLPCLQLDRARGNYRLQEAKLIEVMLEAASMDKGSRAAAALAKWKHPGSKAAGDFAAVLKDVSRPCQFARMSWDRRAHESVARSVSL